MKTKMINTYKIFAAIVVLMLFASSDAWSQISRGEQIKRGFTVDKNTIIDIDNKYGDVIIETWQHDSVWVEIDYEVTEKNHDRLRRKMDEIHFELTHTGHYMVINTIIRSNRNMLLNELIRLRETIGVGESQVKINMKIKVPDNLDLRVKNKFGNVHIDNYNGNVTVDLANGRFTANELTGYVKMKISFADAIIHSIDTGNLEVYYGEMNLAIGRKIRLTSKTSNITITEANDLFVNSSRDSYLIRMINDFETQASWTNFTINDLKNKADIKMNYGQLNIDHIRPAFDNLQVDARSTRIQVYLDQNIDVNFDITTNRDIEIPDESIIDHTELINDKDKIMRYKGRTADIKAANPKIIMNTTSTNISILKR